MSIINNGLLLASGADAATGYQISRSIRLNSADSAYFSRTPGSAGNRKTWTWSGWVKKTATTQGTLFSAYKGSGSVNDEYLGIDFFSDNLRVTGYSTQYKTTTQVFRDPSAWYHIVVAIDTTNATADDRVKLYVNGTQITTFSTVNNPSLNADLGANQASEHTIGRQTSFGAYFDGYLADIYFLDGTATTPSTFAETDAITGQWVPKTPTGISYGTNGFRLTFSDNSGTTSTTLGKDAAGSNNFTPNNFSVASGSGNDSLTDSPTSYGTDTGAGGEVRGNYATLNPLNAAHTYSNGNLDLTISTASHASIPPAVGSIGISSGKWYFEFTPTSITSNPLVGITAVPNTDRYPGYSASSYGYYASDGWKYNNASSSSYGSTWAANDVIGVAFDSDAGKLWFSKNGTWQASGNPASGTNAAFTSIPAGTYFPSVHKDTTGSGTFSGVFNFGQRAFAYTAPSGFKALCDTNLTAPTIAKPADYFDAKLYTGNGSTLTVSGLNFGPELVWIKSRSNAYDHGLFDAVRGTTKRLVSNATQAEDTQSGITAFNSDGFTLGSYAGQNGSSATYVAWAWDAAGSNSTNTSGTITSTVRANATAGFSIVTYTGPGPSNNTVGHGLGVAPELIITKNRDRSIYWTVYTKTTGKDAFLRLNTTDATIASSNIWGTAAPTSTVFGGVGTDFSNGYTAGEKIVSYCFAPVAGYSSFGSYTGNGSSDGPFVFTGHRSRWLMVKRTDVANEWTILDTARSTYNEAKAELYPSASAAEGANGGPVDINSNGFKLRTTASNWNTSSGTYIYASFAEFPFAYARAR